MNTNQDSKKRAPRNPLSSEEVSEIVAFKKYKQLVALVKFKKTKHYKYLNVFCIVSFFIYCELIFCFVGPCHYNSHQIQQIAIEYNRDKTNELSNSIYSFKLYDVYEKFYQIIINDRIAEPIEGANFLVGKDYLFQKEIKVKFDKDGSSYRIKSAEAIIFLSCFVGIILVITFFYNLNQNPNSLNAIGLMNIITILCLLVI